MKKIVAVILALIASPATAQEWTGWYVGLETGYHWESHKSLVTMDTRYRSDWHLGFVAGNLWDADFLLVGFEGHVGMNAYTGPRKSDFVTGFSTTQMYGSIIGKVAAPAGRFLPYLGAGLYAGSYVSEIDTIFSERVTNNGMGMGPIGTMGIEIAITDAMSAKAEFQVTGATIDIAASNGASSVLTPSSALNIGLNYRF